MMCEGYGHAAARALSGLSALVLLLAVQQLLLCPVVAKPQPEQGAEPDALPQSTFIVPTETGQPAILQTMFNDALSKVLFRSPSFTLVPAAWAYVSPETPYVLARNFTVSSDHSPPTVINWSLLESKVVMRPGSSWLLERLVLMNIRKLHTFYFDFFINSPGAVVSVHDTIIIDPVCNATDAVDDLAAAQALPQVPMQRTNVVNAAPKFCLQLPTGDECFTGGVLMHDLAVVVSSTSPNSRSIARSAADAAEAAASGHFIITYHNTTRVCRKYLDSTCLQQHNDNRTFCWEQQAATLLAAGVTTSGTSTKRAGLIAGAVTGGVVGLLGLLVAAWLLRRRYKRCELDTMEKSAVLKGTAAHGPNHHGMPDENVSVNSTSMLHHPGTESFSLDAPAHASFGRDGIHLGVLLGAGSYGRVFKGRWHGRDVAIKIIHCAPSELPRVLREAEIMLQLDHPNCVRAFNCIVHQKPGAATSSSLPGSSGLQTDQVASQQGGSSGGSSRKRSTASSVSQVLPILRRGSAESCLSTQLHARHQPQGAAAAAAGCLGDGSSASSTGISSRSGLAAAAASDRRLLTPALGNQQRHTPKGSVNVPPAVMTGSQACRTGGSTPDQAREQHLQQADAEDGGGNDDDDEDVGAHVAEVWLVLELCTGGNLKDSFRQHRDGFDMARLLCRLAEVAQGMAYLHSKQIIHGDLKAANVLLVNSLHGTFGQIAKLTDFGLANVLRDGRSHNSTQNLGTISHCAPEVLADGHMSPAADVYAFAIMMWELLTSRTAFKDEHYGNIIQRVVMGGHRPPIPPETPEDFVLLMEACWNSNPAQRPSFKQILECLTIMINSMDAVTPTTGNAHFIANSTTTMPAAAAGAVQTLHQADVEEQQVSTVNPAGLEASGRSSLGSFVLSRTASNPSNAQVSSSACSSRLRIAASAGSDKLGPAAAAQTAHGDASRMSSRLSVPASKGSSPAGTAMPTGAGPGHTPGPHRGRSHLNPSGVQDSPHLEQGAQRDAAADVDQRWQQQVRLQADAMADTARGPAGPAAQPEGNAAVSVAPVAPSRHIQDL